MKTKRIAKLAAVAALACTLAAGVCACSTTNSSSYQMSESSSIVKLAVTEGEYEIIADSLTDPLSNYGVTLELTEYDDATAAMDALCNGEIDAAYCTDLPHVTQYNNENGTDLTVKGAETFSKMALYSKTVSSLDELPDGAAIAIPSDAMGTCRALQMLNAAGVITLSESVDASTSGGLSATLESIESNPQNLTFEQVDESELVSALSSVDAACIPYSVATNGGLEFDDALTAETDTSASSWAFADVIVLCNTSEGLDKLDKLYTAFEYQDVIDGLESTFGDAVISTCSVLDEQKG